MISCPSVIITGQSSAQFSISPPPPPAAIRQGELEGEQVAFAPKTRSSPFLARQPQSEPSQNSRAPRRAEVAPATNQPSPNPAGRHVPTPSGALRAATLVDMDVNKRRSHAAAGCCRPGARSLAGVRGRPRGRRRRPSSQPSWTAGVSSGPRAFFN